MEAFIQISSMNRKEGDCFTQTSPSSLLVGSRPFPGPACNSHNAAGLSGERTSQPNWTRKFAQKNCSLETILVQVSLVAGTIQGKGFRHLVIHVLEQLPENVNGQMHLVAACDRTIGCSSSQNITQTIVMLASPCAWNWV